MLYVPNSIDLKMTILDELAQKVVFWSSRIRENDNSLKKQFYWPNMKNETTEYLSKCLDCQ
jgi:hypothetical protein